MAKPGVTKQLFLWMQEYGGREYTGASYARGGRILEERLSECLDQIARAGFQGVEGWLNSWSTPDRAAEVSRLLEERGLSCPTLYGEGDYHDAEAGAAAVARQLEQAKIVRDLLGVEALTIDPFPKADGEKTDEELAIEAANLEKLGEGLARLGMRLGVHNHTPQAVNDARELRAIAAGTDPELVTFALDVQWIHRAGVDPYAFVEEFAGRTSLVHVRNSIDGVWAESFGDGDIDYARIAKLLEQGGFSGRIVVEVAYEPGTRFTRSLDENLKASSEYARRIFGV